MTKVTTRVAALMGNHKKKISEVARDTGISRTTLTNLYYETNQAVSFDTLSKLCSYFQCDIGDILIIRKD